MPRPCLSKCDCSIIHSLSLFRSALSFYLIELPFSIPRTCRHALASLWGAIFHN